MPNVERRTEYDARKKEMPQPAPLSTWIDFMDNIEGELNRRSAVLAVLYVQHCTSPHSPEVSFLEMERRMGFPRDYLEFTVWYLYSKGYITRADNSDFKLTAEGKGFVETQRVNNRLLDKLLTFALGLPPQEKNDTRQEGEP